MKDISGERFGLLVALYPTEKRVGRNVVWHCKCDCGNEVETIGNNLIQGRTKSCGCLKGKDISGLKFGKLTVKSPTLLRDAAGSIVWGCQCDCGNVVYVSGADLRAGRVNSCGCAGNNAFYKKLMLLKQFVSVFNRTPAVSDSYNGEKIGDWFYRQKLSYKKGELSEEKIKAMNDAGISLDAVSDKLLSL